MRRLSILVTAVTVLLVGAAPVLANNAWNGYHWADGSGDPHDGSITLTLVNNLTEYGGLYGDVVDDWDSGTSGFGGPLTLSTASAARPIACDNVATEAAGDEIVGRIHVCNKRYGTNGWLGLARIWLGADGHIDAGVALMNDTYMLDDSTYADANAQRHVLCQEVGHTFGLDHVGGPKKVSCMNDRWGLWDPAFIGPNEHDFDTLNAIYGTSSGDDGGGGSSKPCNPNRPNCPSNGANVHYQPRPGGGWIVTYTIPPGKSAR